MKQGFLRFDRFAIKGIIVLAIAATLFASVFYFRASCNSKVEKITIGMESTPVNSLIYIAQKQDYFSANGLDVTIRDNYPSGAAAVDAMLNGQVDIATAAEFAIVRKALESREIQTFASIDKFMHQNLIGSKDRGIVNISDLSGKRIGVPLKTAADFNFSRFLDLHNIPKDRLTLVEVQAPQAVDALMNGSVDAVVAWQPNVMALKERLGDDARFWSIQNDQPTFCAVITTNKWAQGHPASVHEFLKALMQAEDYAINNPAQAEAVVQKCLNYENTYMQEIWPTHQLSLSLDMSLVAAMEDQARWMIQNDLTTEKQTPNFLNYISEDALKSARPGAVNIIR